MCFRRKTAWLKSVSGSKFMEPGLPNFDLESELPHDDLKRVDQGFMVRGSRRSQGVSLVAFERIRVWVDSFDLRFEELGGDSKKTERGTGTRKSWRSCGVNLEAIGRDRVLA